LIREQWGERQANFDIDHIVPRSVRPDLECEYDNLLYVTHRINLVRGAKTLPDPSGHNFARCMEVNVEGDSPGEICALNAIGAEIIGILRLDSDDATRYRRQIILILRSLAETNVATFLALVGYPNDLPDLSKSSRNCPSNTRPSGVKRSAYRRRLADTLEAWY
jgi:hypothetical protein